jgi:hypothetical protein
MLSGSALPLHCVFYMEITSCLEQKEGGNTALFGSTFASQENTWSYYSRKMLLTLFWVDEYDFVKLIINDS